MTDTDVSHTDVHEWVQEYYGEILKASQDLKTNACCAVAMPSARIRELWNSRPSSPKVDISVETVINVSDIIRIALSCVKSLWARPMNISNTFFVSALK